MCFFNPTCLSLKGTCLPQCPSVHTDPAPQNIDISYDSQLWETENLPHHSATASHYTTVRPCHSSCPIISLLPQEYQSGLTEAWKISQSHFINQTFVIWKYIYLCCLGLWPEPTENVDSFSFRLHIPRLTFNHVHILAIFQPFSSPSWLLLPSGWIPVLYPVFSLYFLTSVWLGSAVFLWKATSLPYSMGLASFSKSGAWYGT